MTAQIPERLIVDGKPRAMGGDPLYRALKHSRFSLSDASPFYTTACYRGYRATWLLHDKKLYFAHINQVADQELPFPEDLRAKLLRCVGAKAFPVFAEWFNGEIRVPIGPQLVNSFHGMRSHWFVTMRVLHFKAGVVVRDRLVDTHRMIEWVCKRYPRFRTDLYDTGGGPEGTIEWFNVSKDDDWGADVWPPDFPLDDPKQAYPTIHWTMGYFLASKPDGDGSQHLTSAGHSA